MNRSVLCWQPHGYTADNDGGPRMTRYQWLVLAAAWFGWGFDVFDALLFNFVAPNTVPTLLGLEHGSHAARDATVLWTGVLSSILLIGWAMGGVLFGWYADRHGRRRALFVTVGLYAVGTALCAAATSMGQLIAFRVIASLGIGGEWAVGAALVAETVPENRRVFAGTLLYTASPLGLLLAGAVNYQVAGVWFAHDPANSWRYVFSPGSPVVLRSSCACSSTNPKRTRTRHEAAFAVVGARGTPRDADHSSCQWRGFSGGRAMRSCRCSALARRRARAGERRALKTLASTPSTPAA